MQITQAEYARLHGVSRQRIGQKVKKGILKLLDNGLIDSEQPFKRKKTGRPKGKTCTKN